MSRAPTLLKAFFCILALAAVLHADAQAQLKKGKLRKTENKTCIDCHQDEVRQYKAGKSTHPAVLAEDCQACHLRHGVVGVLRLTAEDPDLCLSCHKMEGMPETGTGPAAKGATTAAATGSHLFAHPPSGVLKCGSCHDPHASDRPHLLKETGSGSCLTCHDAASFEGASRHSSDRADCLICHDPHGSDRAASLAREEAGLCVSCHDGGSQAEKKGHGGGAPAGDACLSCHSPHASAAKGLLRRNVHPPMAEGGASCSSCHAPEPGAAFALQAPVLELCLTCHEDPRDPGGDGAVDRVHSPVAEGDCVQCHSPHASDHASLLSGTQTEVCGVCHTEAAAATQSKVPHEPAAGECTTCHLPHAGTARLLREKTPALCETCHAGVGEEIARRMPHPPAAEGECMTCHDPHGTDNKGILIDNPRMLCGSCHDTETELSLRVTHAPATSGDCSACHEPHGSQADHMLVADLGKACLSCHKREEALAAQHPHAPFESGDCISCHRPHGSAKEALLAMDPAVLCASCHDEGTGGSSLLVRHLPVRRGQCLACHDPHGGQTDTLLRRRDDRTLCLSCHVDQGDTLSRSDYHVHPPFKEGSCLECHNAHESPRDALLAKAPGELCSGCHDAADPAMTAPHRGLIDSGTDCTACHDGHATADENLLLADQHEPFIDRNCAACHRGAAP